MGIRKLFQLINDMIPEAINVIPIEQLHGWVVGVDMSIFIYQWCMTGRAKHIVNKSGKFINHIQGAFFRIIKMLTLGITPVCIFDGPPPIAKKKVIDERRKPIPSEVFEEIKKLMRMMNIDIVEAPSEADGQAAMMVKEKIIQAIMTEDSDVLVFGVPLMIRGFNTSAKEVVMIDRDKLLEKLEMDEMQFIDLCIILGCDYSPRLDVSYKKAVSLIKKYKNIEQIIDSGQAIPSRFDYKSARREFMNPSWIVTDVQQFRGAINIENLRHYLVEIHGLDPKKVEKVLTVLTNL
jgi:flap endonuclease-1